MLQRVPDIPLGDLRSHTGRIDLLASDVQHIELFHQDPGSQFKLFSAYRMVIPELIHDWAADSRTTASGDLNGDGHPDVALSDGDAIILLYGEVGDLPIVVASGTTPSTPWGS